MNIPALSVNLELIDTKSKVGVAMLSKSLDTVEANGEAMVQMMNQSMELSVNPHLGGNINLML